MGTSERYLCCLSSFLDVSVGNFGIRRLYPNTLSKVQLIRSLNRDRVFC